MRKFRLVENTLRNGEIRYRIQSSIYWFQWEDVNLDHHKWTLNKGNYVPQPRTKEVALEYLNALKEEEKKYQKGKKERSVVKKKYIYG